MRSFALATILATGSISFSGTSIAQEESWVDKLVGKWTLNAAKSRLPTEYSVYTKKEEKLAPRVLRTEIDIVAKSGEKTHRIVTRTCDGQERHSDGLPEGETEICGPGFTVVGKRGGKVWSEMKASFSPDGNAHTVIRKAMNADGKWIETVAVFERQQ